MAGTAVHGVMKMLLRSSRFCQFSSGFTAIPWHLKASRCVEMLDIIAQMQVGHGSSVREQLAFPQIPDSLHSVD